MFLEKKKLFGKIPIPGRSTMLKTLLIIAVIAIIVWFIKCKFISNTPIGFTVLNEASVPQQMTTQIIPEYRDLERALACIVDDKVYVMVTRGEKPTTGYEVSIDSMKLTGQGENESLVVNAIFTDPKAGTSLTQAVTYPLVVAQTDMEYLPPKIELKVKYAD